LSVNTLTEPPKHSRGRFGSGVPVSASVIAAPSTMPGTWTCFRSTISVLPNRACVREALGDFR
jgi:hypothetical protein